MKRYGIVSILVMTAWVIMAQAGPSNIRCEDAIPVSTEDLVTGAFVQGDSYNIACLNEAVKGVWFSVTGNGKFVDLTMGSGTGQLQYQFFSGDCNFLQCLGQGNGFVSLQQDSTYYLLIYEYTQTVTEDTFLFFFESRDVPDYDGCATAPVLDCGSSFTLDFDLFSQSMGEDYAQGWFQIHGDHKNYTLSLTGLPADDWELSFAGADCNSGLVQKDLGSAVSWTGLRNESYFFTLYDSIGLTDSVQVLLSCADIAPGQSCEVAQSLTCTNQETDTLVWTGIIDFDHPGLTSSWWTYDGDSSKARLQLINTGSDTLLWSVMYGRPDQDSTCYDFVVIDEERIGPGALWTHKVALLGNYRYYFRVSGMPGASYQLNLTCDTLIEEGLNCTLAIHTGCQDTLQPGYVLAGLPLSDSTFTESNGYWYTWNSQTGLPSWELSDSASRLSFEIFKGSCGNLQGVYAFSGTADSLQKWEVTRQDSQQVYYLVITGSASDTDTFFLSQQCELDACLAADTLRCGDTTALISDKNIRISLAGDGEIENFSYWWSFVSAGEILTWNETQEGTMDVFRGDCHTLVQDSSQTASYYGLIKLATQQGETYQMIWRADNDTTALPFVSFNCEMPDSADVCAGAIQWTCGMDTIVLTDEGAMPDQTDTGCGNVKNTKWLKFSGNNSIITMTGGQMALFSGSCDTLNCLGSNEYQLRFYADEQTFYYLAVETTPLETTTLLVDCVEVAGNNDCSSAALLSCDTLTHLHFAETQPDTLNDTTGNLYYTIEGDGNVWKLSIPSAKAITWRLNAGLEGCDSTLLAQAWQTEGDTMAFFEWESMQGQLLWIEIQSDSLDSGILQTSCRRIIPGVDCIHAIDAECGDTLYYTTETGEPWGDQHNVMWFKLNNAIGEVSIGVLQDTIQTMATWQYGSGCDQLSALLPAYASDDSLSFFTHGNNDLFLILGTNAELKGGSEMLIQCREKTSSPDCATATPLNCDQQHRVYATHTITAGPTACTEDRQSTWFTVSGNDQYWTALGTDGQATGKIYLYQGGCEALICLDTFELGSSGINPSFFAPKGQEFLMQYILNEAGSSSVISWSCRPYYANNACGRELPISCGDTITGNTWLAPEVSENGCNATGKALYYTFTGDGNYLRIRLTEGRAQINLIETDCATGRCLFSQQLGAARHSVLVSTKVGQVYYLRVGAPDSVLFSFELTCFEPPRNPGCLEAENAMCGESFINDLQTPVGYSQSHPCIGLPRTQHWYYLSAGDNPLVELVPAAGTDSFKVLLIRGNCDTYECIAQYSSNDDKIIMQVEDGYDYYMAIYGNVFDEGIAMFSLQCGGYAVNDSCVNAVALVCPQSINVPLHLASSDDGPSCYDTDDVSLWYEVTGENKGLELKVMNASQGFEGEVLIYKGDACATLSCFYQSSIAGNTLPAYRWIGEAGVNYYIAIYSHNKFYPGTLDIDLSCFDSAPRDTCGGADLLTDGEYLLMPSAMTTDTIEGCNWVVPQGEWYTWKSDGKSIIFTNSGTYPLQMKVFGGDCGILQCFYQVVIMPGDQWELSTQLLKNYYFLFNSEASFQAEGQKFKVKFIVPSPNDECFGALPLSCGQLVSIRNDNFTEDTEVNLGCDEEHRDKIWYTFKGDGGIRTLKYIIPDVDGSVVFTDGCSNPCFYVSEFFASLATEFSFSTVPEKTYYLGMGTKAQPSNKRVRMQMECEDGYPHTTKEFALPLVCGEYILDYNDAKINLLNTCGSNNQFVQLYYSFTGDGTDLILKGNPNPGAFFKVVNEDCVSVHDFAFGGKTFKTSPGVKYYFLVSYFPGINQTEQQFGIDYRCGVNTTEEPVGQRLVVYPNPSSGKFSLKLEGNSPFPSAELCIRDATGRVVMQKTLEDLRPGLVFESQAWARGVYTASVTNAAENLMVRFVVIE